MGGGGMSERLLIWGIVVHLACDWMLQNEWMAVNKMKRRVPAMRPGDGLITPPRMYQPSARWWDRHPAAYVHSGIHLAGMLLVFPWWAAVVIATTHLLIDTRVPVVWWSQLIRQTQPDPSRFPLMDIGADVRIWVDQVWHIAVVALTALAVAA